MTPSMKAGFLATALAGLGVSSAEAGHQGQCTDVTLNPDAIQSTTLEVYAFTPELGEPLEVLQRDALPDSFVVTDCGQPVLLWRRAGTPYLIQRTKVSPQALGDDALCQCPRNRGEQGRQGAAPGLGVPMCPREQCS